MAASASHPTPPRWVEGDRSAPEGSCGDLFPLGEIAATRREPHPGIGDATLLRVAIHDPVLGTIGVAERRAVEEEERHFAALAAARRERLLWHRRPGLAYDDRGDLTDTGHRGWGDSHPETGTKAAFMSRMGAGYQAWHSHVPSAAALRFLSGPHHADSIRHRKTGRIEVLDDNLRTWMVACSDAVGIRARAAIMGAIVRSYCEEDRTGPFSWLSVACGTALPVFQTATGLGARFESEMTLVDIDEAALRTAVDMHSWFAVEGSIRTMVGNVFDPQFLNGFRADIVDAMGIFEYIGEPVIELQARLGVATGPAEFLAQCYASARHRLIFGQMLPERPNPDWTMGVIGWPYVEMRSIEEVLRLIQQAGIPTAEVTIYVPEENPVYAVYEIRRH